MGTPTLQRSPRRTTPDRRTEILVRSEHPSAFGVYKTLCSARRFGYHEKHRVRGADGDVVMSAEAYISMPLWLIAIGIWMIFIFGSGQAGKNKHQKGAN